MIVQFTIHSPSGQKTVSIKRYAILIVGRSKKAHICLNDDPHFSRRHFRLEVASPKCHLIDLDSRNGTFVNDKPVQSVELKNGDVISGGETKIYVSIHHETSANSTFNLPGNSDNTPVQTPLTANSPPEPSPKDPVSPPKVNLRLGHFELLQEIGHGSMGTVYHARNLNDQEIVALKIIFCNGEVDSTHKQLFVRESQLMNQLSHPRLVSFREAGEIEGQLYLSMEYVEHQKFENHSFNMSPAKRIRFACGIISQTLDVLEFLHESQVVHRDIKPANLLLANVNNQLLVKVADLGLAKNYRDSGVSGITSEGEGRGTLAFMPPEQLAGSRDVGPAADLYSTAATLYWYLTGEYPYDFLPGHHPVAIVLSGKRVDIRKRRTKIPPALADIIEKGLNESPEARFESAIEMRNQLRPFLRRDATE
ncbi:FHA domain-containing serine/threonine-protein kinase [Thalassoglobus polymorphus]|uniref:Serine/threonine-protein kinase PknB n=1 Tax=Thalassoglobus polymorphus TaxID=2527994 RepID=A0A517QU71_9PLAN|nr:FHA domain-containing serine/threonine-protein kinase [Thalassoglobus polymorphus]QDT35189.1 Serine/threonine-protein kinase PknB [Thalassoglobus polymorphus]